MRTKIKTAFHPSKDWKTATHKGFVELLSRFELETSSLPRMRSTD